MSKYHQIRIPKEAEKTLKKRPETSRTRDTSRQPDLSPGAERSPASAGRLSPTNVLQLQRTVGNQAVEHLLANRTAGQMTKTTQQPIQRSIEEEEELICPGSKIRSDGQGRGEGYGEDKGPIRNPKDEEWG